MSKFELVKDYYERGLWSLTRVRNAVVKGWITIAEFEVITGLPELEGASDAIKTASEIALEAASKAREAAEASKQAVAFAASANATADAISDALQTHKVDPEAHENLEIDGNQSW